MLVKKNDVENILGKEYPPFYVDIEDCFIDRFFNKNGRISETVLIQAYKDLYEAILEYIKLNYADKYDIDFYKKISFPQTMDECQNLIEISQVK